MKTIYIKHLHEAPETQIVEVLGWVKAIRKQKRNVFMDVMDGTGAIQVVVSKENAEELFELATKVKRESAIKVIGVIRCNDKNINEVVAHAIEVIGETNLSITPRADVDIFSSERADHLLRNRHMYLRNPKAMAILKFRHLLMGGVHDWFRKHDFVEITAPVLTQLPLYDDGTAINLNLHGENIYLTQCVGYYLEAAAHAFERVYNMGPSFRGEESRSKRHLMEYWHIKAEMTFANLEDGMGMVESLVTHLTRHCMESQDAVTDWLKADFNADALSAPFPRTTYAEVVELLNSKGKFDFPFGKSLGHEQEVWLSKHFNSPLWVVGVPRTVEPFPYVIDPEDDRLTRTADLIASRGYGELLGVAEKTTDMNMLVERMKEKGKYGKPEYDWLLELRDLGCVPHIGFGIGLERFLRYILQVPHVRDCIPFPRTFRRSVYP